MPKQSGSTTTTTNASPWSVQAPYLGGLFGGAQQAYGAYGSNPASSVAQFTPEQNQSFGLTQYAANNGNPAGNISGLNTDAANFSSTMLNGGFLGSNPANPMLNSVAQGNTAPGQALNAMATGASAPDQALGQFASGLMVNNPYAASAMQALTDPIVRAYQTATAPSIASDMEAGGRFGSGAMANAQSQAQQNLVTQLGNTLSPFESGLYQTNMGNMLAGANALAGNETNAANSSLNSTLGALSQLGGNYNTGVGQMVQQSALSPSLAGSNWETISNLGNVGAQGQTMNQNILNSPFSLLGQYGNLIQGQYGGQGTSTSPYFTNPGAGLLGGAAAGAQLGSIIPGLGTGIGAGLGGLLGALSDRRAKTDIERVGRLDNGLNVYRYRYKMGGPAQIGVMADEVRQVNPGAVININGLDHVNYGAL